MVGGMKEKFGEGDREKVGKEKRERKQVHE